MYVCVCMAGTFLLTLFNMYKGDVFVQKSTTVNNEMI